MWRVQSTTLVRKPETSGFGSWSLLGHRAYGLGLVGGGGVGGFRRVYLKVQLFRGSYT